MAFYEPGSGSCSRRLNLYSNLQQYRSQDNNIEFWRNFVTEFFTPCAKVRWCFSLFKDSCPRGEFSEGIWDRQLYHRKPGRGFEVTAEQLPRLFKAKYDSGTLEEFLLVDMACEYQTPTGEIVVHYPKATEKTVYEKVHIVREGQLVIVLTPELKICSWEFCAQRIEHLITGSAIRPQVGLLGDVTHSYQLPAQKASSNLKELRECCDMFASSALQFSKTLEVPLLNDIGYTQKYVRFLEEMQMSQVLNCMKGVIDYNRKTGMSPKMSFVKLFGSTNQDPPSGWPSSSQQAHGDLQQSFVQKEVANNCPQPKTSRNPLTPAAVVQINDGSEYASASVPIQETFKSNEVEKNKSQKSLDMVSSHFHGSGQMVGSDPLGNNVDQNEFRNPVGKRQKVAFGAVGNEGNREQGSSSINGESGGGNVQAANELVNEGPGIGVSVTAVETESATISEKMSTPSKP